MTSIRLAQARGEQKIRTLCLSSPRLVKHLMGLAVEGSIGQLLRASPKFCSSRTNSLQATAINLHLPTPMEMMVRKMRADPAELMHDKVRMNRNRQELTLAKHALQVRTQGGEKVPGGIHTWSSSSGMTSLDPGVLRPVNIRLYPRGLLLLRRSGTTLLSKPVLDPSRQQQCNLIAVFLQKRKMAVSSGTGIDQSGKSNIHTCLP